MSHSVGASGRPSHRPRRANTLTAFERGALAALAVLLIAVAASSGYSRPDDVPTTTVLVKAGDTLWSVARTHPVDGLSTMQTADLILELNDATSPVLLDGQALVVPGDPASRSLALR